LHAGVTHHKAKRGDFSQTQYEQVREQVLPGNRLVPGLLSHVAGPGENGWCVVEVWESQPYSATSLYLSLSSGICTLQ